MLVEIDLLYFFENEDENENIFWDLANFKLYKNIPLNKKWVNLVHT